MKTLFFLLMMAVSTVVLPAQNLSTTKTTPVTIYGIQGPSGVGMILLFNNPPSLSGYEVSVQALGDASLVSAKMITGEAKIGVLPPNVAAKIASTGKDVEIAAVIGNGMLSLLSRDASIKSIADLKGKTVAVAGQGATPDYVFRTILKANGIDPDKDLRLDYSLAPPEIARSLIAGRVSVALLPEPFATQALSGSSNITQVGDIQQEWVASGGQSNYPMTVLVVDGAFARANRLLINVIREALQASIQWVNANPLNAGTLVEAQGWGMTAAVAAAAIPRSNYTFVPAVQARPALEALFKAFLAEAPQSIGGKLPADRFYLQ
jgi:NitT/TauT family transport system substrate-binding protein